MSTISPDAEIAEGAFEAKVLDDSKLECYRATSSRFAARGVGHCSHHPFIDEQRLAASGVFPRWPDNAPFAVCLTHDVDSVAWHSPVMHWRQMRNQLYPAIGNRNQRAMRGLRSTAAVFCASLVRLRRRDPLFCYERWLELEAEVGARSTFLFLPDSYGQRHYSNGGYRYGDRVVFNGKPCTVAQMMREIHRRGWEVGLHASWHSFDSAEEMIRQRRQVEAAIDAKVVSVRHHHLHFDVRCTPRVQQEAGLEADSSIGFNDDIGFRYGTSLPWRLRDLRSGESLNVLELPLAIQEKCLIRILAQGNQAKALEIADDLISNVKAVGGLLTLLWHPETVRFPLYVEVYRRLLHALREQGAWFATMADVNRWWRRTRTV